MDILVIAEKKGVANPIVAALKEKGAHAQYLRVSKITLVSKQKETLIKSLGEKIPYYDAVIIQVRATLAPFIEPLLEELHDQECYVSAKKGAYYNAMNEPYQFVTLALEDIPTPKTLTSGSAKNIEKVSTRISYPLIAKYFVGRKAQQEIVVETSTELNHFIKSIRTETDGFMLREYIPGDAISCAVIGKKVFAVKRKQKDEIVPELSAGETYKLSEEDHKTAISAAHACGFDIARVDLAKGRVVKIEPMIPWAEFDRISSESLEETAASFLIEKAKTNRHKNKPKFSFFGLEKLIEKTALGGRLK
ncbi:Ribosomal protein S6--L-glutamate ligase [uncultured archaeon]|nr:Ribosomal protein S6--L-glutamate ligase [uncultured archaeon]